MGLALLLVLSGVASCSQDSSTGNGSEQVEQPGTVPVPGFDRDSAFQFVERQLAFGPRVPGTDAHRETADWLAATLERFGAEVIRQEFTARAHWGETLSGVNIIGQFNPGAGKRVVLAAHWDTRYSADSPLAEDTAEEGVPGADDGASGVSVLLEIARQLSLNPIDMGVDIVFFDLEDQGKSGGSTTDSWGLGSQYWSKNLHRNPYRPEYGILLDMVGARNARFAREHWSVYFAEDLVNKVWDLAAKMGYGNYFEPVDGGGVIDDHYFVNTEANIPMIDIINRPPESETGFGDHWHTLDDDIDVIDKRTLGAVGQVVLAVVYRENNRTF